MRWAWSLVSEYMYLDFGLQKPLQWAHISRQGLDDECGWGSSRLDLRLSFLHFIPTAVSYGIVVEK